MKRILTSALILGLFSAAGLVGCGNEEKAKTTETVSGPGGATTVTTEKKVDSSGSNPPATTTGEKVEPPK